MRSMWLRAGPTSGTVTPVFGQSGSRLIRVLGLAGLGVFLGLLWMLGVAAWS
jgi:hypothetical protein